MSLRTWSQQPEQRAVDVMAVTLSRDHKVDQPEIPALNEERAATGCEGQLLHGGNVVMKDLNTQTHKHKTHLQNSADILFNLKVLTST